jgi:hypothetical protein
MAQRRLIILLALAIATIALVALSLPSCSHRDQVAGSKGTERVVIGGHDFTLELANDDASREQGLMNRASVDEHGGMLFVFPDDKVRMQSFWMKNCLVDIDIIYLDRHAAVTAMHRMKAEPPKRAEESEAAYEARIRAHTYPSGYPAQFAIELRSGWLDQLNLKVDDRIALDVERLKAAAR